MRNFSYPAMENPSALEAQRGHLHSELEAEFSLEHHHGKKISWAQATANQIGIVLGELFQEKNPLFDTYVSHTHLNEGRTPST
jgi:hypothetical protein